MTILTFLGYFLMFMLYSFMGWLMEVVLSFLQHKKFVNRGFLIGPYCPIYGYGCLTIVILLKKYTNNALVLFILAMVVCMVLEYLTSYFMELVFKARWWDYSNKRFNINGRICLETAIPFGLGGVFIMYIVHPFVSNITLSLNETSIYVLGILLLIIYLVDNIISFKAISNINHFEFKKYKDNTEDITKMVRNYLLEHSYFTKRLVKAFPGAAIIRNIKEKRKGRN